MAVDWPDVSFVDDGGENTISMVFNNGHGVQAIQLSKGQCISFDKGEPDQRFRGKITGFGSSDGIVNRIFYKPWTAGAWSQGRDGDIALTASRVSLTGENWKSIEIIPCPDLIQSGGRRRNTRRRRQRKSTHSRKYRK